ncbi:50S ribosomal protein L4 [Candidatus Uhrbacteria bacterium]|nr:50S ribosomal protein L4 [Candidatus Uhrbacteria bacterium]
MQLPVYNQQGQKVSTLEVSQALFGVKPKAAVLHQAVVAQQANARVSIAHTKKRGEVRGGGKKPWKQKGTGRARHGSIRSPLWRGGGITFGPRSNRNFKQKVNRKVRRAALAMALSDKVFGQQFLVLENLTPALKKTKAVMEILNKLPLKRGKTILALPSALKEVGHLAANARGVTAMWVGSFNVVDILRHQNLITTVEGVKEMEKIYAR